MRLIYADGLKEVFKEKGSEAVCGVELCKAIISQIDNQPTVEAIPVQWLEDFRDGLDMLSESQLMLAIDLIIDAYRVEKKREEE